VTRSAFASIAVSLLVNSFAAADVLDDVRKSGVLIWGGDQEGGGPLIFPDADNGNKLSGVEVELAELIAAELGVKAVFQQGQWENVPSLLDKGDVHLALNGFELKPVIARDYLTTRPYYSFGLQLLAPADGPLQTWDDVRRIGKTSKVRIGVLGTSAAETFLKEHFADFAEPQSFSGNTDGMTAVENRQIDAALQDDCVAIFYADRFRSLRFVDRPQPGGFYVGLVKRGEERFRDAMDQAIAKLIDDGRLEKLYDKWKLSGRLQMLLLRGKTTMAAAGGVSFQEIVSSHFGLLVQAAGMTVFLSFVSMPLAILAGLLIAVGRMYGPAPVRWLGTVYVEVIRGTPLMLQLYAIYFLLPKIGLSVPALIAAITGLAINYSAYEAEIYRAGLQAIPKGQWEAALSLGMSPRQALWRIIVPQAVRIVIPPVTNDFIALFKDTSVCSVVTVMELTKQYNVLAMSTGAILELAILTSLLYLAMSYPLSLFARWSERRLASGRPLA
jgi:polar amino acid transport system substrate-binding protein